MSVQTGLMRHVEAVQNAVLPGDRIAFRLRDGQVGWIREIDAPLVLEQGFGGTIDESGLTLPDADALPLLAELLAGQGAYTFRNEAFDVRPGFDGEILTTIDRGALPWFGITAEGVHVNGIVERADGPHIWIARRAQNRHMDPGKLDHLCAGGIAAGMTADATLTKEAAEEAGLPEHLANQAVYTGSLRYSTLRPEGLRRDRLHCYDLKLHEDFTPTPQDGEVESFELWPIADVEHHLRHSDDFKFNVALVLVDLMLRWGVLPAESEETQTLTAIFRK